MCTPDARALARGLHHHREGERQRVDAGQRRAPRRRRPGTAAWGCRGEEDLLGEDLLHPHRGGQHARAGVGDEHRLEQSLDAAVLAVAAVQRDEGHVDALVPEQPRRRRPSARRSPPRRSPALAARRRRPRRCAARPRARRDRPPISTPMRLSFELFAAEALHVNAPTRFTSGTSTTPVASAHPRLGQRR